MAVTPPAILAVTLLVNGPLPLPLFVAVAGAFVVVAIVIGSAWRVHSWTDSDLAF